MTTSARSAFVLALESLSIVGLLAIAAVSSSFRFADIPYLSERAAAADQAALEQLGALRLVVPTIRYGLEIERFGDLLEVRRESPARLEDVLRAAGLSRAQSASLAQAAGLEREGVRELGPHTCVTFPSHDAQPAYVMVELNELEFLRFDVAADAVTLEDADGIASEFETMTLFYAGDVDSMLAETSFEGDLANVVRRALLEEMPLDTGFHVGLVKLIYTAKKDELGVTRGFGRVEALRYGLGDQECTTFRFSDSALDVEGFFRPDGTPATRTWLSSPIVNGYMSSPFNLRRKHPVLKRIKPHYGTDYAANYGEPILALSDGVVVAKARNGGNGNFVKIDHDGTYATQYLHLKGFAEGIRPGKRVRKGDVIGYVGSTGLSSGPHVCLRFWKNGRQVDFRRELKRLPTTESLGADAMAAFEQRQAELVELLSPQA